MPELLAIILLALLLAWAALQGRDPMRFLVSVQRVEKPAGWGWLVILVAMGVLAFWLVVRD